MWEIACPISENYLILDRNKTPQFTKEVIMIPIDEEEENFIDNMDTNYILLKRGKRTFQIKHNDIYCYGEVDFNNIEDLEQINKFNFITKEFGGYKIPANYIYEKHCSLSTNKRSALWSETWSSAQVAKYAHGCLNKPQRICLFINKYK